jgi:chromosome segregation ATPase
LKQAEKHNNDFKKIIEDLKSEQARILATKEVQIAELAKVVEDLKVQLRHSHVQMEVVSRLESAVAAEESRSSRLTDTVARMEREKGEAIAQRDSNIAVLNTELATASAELQSSRRQIQNLQQEYVHMKSTLEFEISKRNAFGGRINEDEVIDDQVCCTSELNFFN